MKHFSRAASWLFGLALVALSLFVAAETVSRKLFNVSFEGADELGGYVLAIGAALSFTVALVERAHVRIDVLHGKFPAPVRAILDWLSAVSLAALGIFLVYIGTSVIRDTIAYGSTAQSPWATPLIYPQSGWFAGYVLFATASCGLAIYATALLVTGRLSKISESFDPKGAADEVREELENVQSR
ncbi:TRAP transporter small permease subunit [Acuticoccus yangtzensis]|uniref:TRAP transporter small permease subunit n=1 Tax=Acuticoccus yangtzensis TaxID=1443441 RepID=UPI00094977A1|nr:TRAP transporter small permease [Acuticoccus yangtzensis]